MIKHIYLLICLLCLTNLYSEANEKEVYIGKVTDQHGDGFYGSSVAYSKNLYLGRVAFDATLQLLDVNVKANIRDIPIIKVNGQSVSDTLILNFNQLIIKHLQEIRRH